MISLFVSSFRMQAINFIAAPHASNIVSVHDFIWSLHLKRDCNCQNYKFLYCAMNFTVFAMVKLQRYFLLCTACYRMHRGWPAQWRPT